MMMYGQGIWAACVWDVDRSVDFDKNIMGSDSKLVAQVVVRECSDVFQGMKI
jgi:hypothetical protein